MSDIDPEPAPSRVLVVDDQALVRSGFRMILEAAGIDVVGEAADGVTALAAARELRPDLVLMDLRMPRMDGIAATKALLDDPGLRCRVLVLSTFDLDDDVYAALAAGATGYLLKDVSPKDLVAAVHTVAAGDALLAPSLTRRLIERHVAAPAPGHLQPQLAALTEREREVLVLVAQGLSNSEISVHLVLSAATVKTHVARVLAKLNVRDRVQAVVVAYESGLVRPGSPSSPEAPG